MDGQNSDTAQSSSEVFATRANYFDGQLLDETDFKTEQEYHREAALQHNRDVHGKGIVRGLDVQWYQGQNYVTVTPGSALDGMGRRISLGNMTVVPLPAAAARYQLMLSFREEETDRREYEGEDALRYVSGFTRIAEKAQLEFLRAGEDETAVVLAALLVEDGTVRKFEPEAREYMELTAGDLKVGSINFLRSDESASGAALKTTEGGDLRVDARQLFLKGGLRTGTQDGESHVVSVDAVFGSLKPVSISGGGSLGFNAYRRGDDWKVFSPASPLGGVELAEPADLVFRVGSAGIADGAGSPAPVRERLRISPAGIDITGDLRVSGRIHEGGQSVTGVGWTPISPRAELGMIPLNEGDSGASREYVLPAEVPVDADEVRIYAFVSIRNNERDQSVETEIYTDDAGRRYSHFIYARCYDPHAGKLEKLAGVPATWISASDNFWLPVTSKRMVGVTVSWLPADGNKAGGDGLLYITGYR